MTNCHAFVIITRQWNWCRHIMWYATHTSNCMFKNYESYDEFAKMSKHVCERDRSHVWVFLRMPERPIDAVPKWAILAVLPWTSIDLKKNKMVHFHKRASKWSIFYNAYSISRSYVNPQCQMAYFERLKWSNGPFWHRREYGNTWPMSFTAIFAILANFSLSTISKIEAWDTKVNTPPYIDDWPANTLNWADKNDQPRFSSLIF